MIARDNCLTALLQKIDKATLTYERPTHNARTNLELFLIYSAKLIQNLQWWDMSMKNCRLQIKSRDPNNYNTNNFLHLFIKLRRFQVVKQWYRSKIKYI